MRPTRILGAVALAVAITSGIVVLPAIAKVTSSRPSGDPNDGVSKAEGMAIPSSGDVATAEALASVSGLRETLRRKFPDEFAGLYNSGEHQHDTFTILTTGPDSHALKAYVSSWLGQLPVNAKAPQFNYAAARVTLNELFVLRDRVFDDMGLWRGQGIDINMVAIDDAHGVVVVTLRAPAENPRDRLADAYGSEALRVAVKPLSFLDRVGDVGPWNGGNAPVRAWDHAGGTNGFGVHSGATG